MFCLAALFAVQTFAGGTIPNPTNTDAVADGLVQLQAQLHAAQLQIEQGREENAAMAQSNSDAMNARIAQLEQAISAQRASDAEVARRTQQLTLYLIGSFGFAGLLVLLLMGCRWAIGKTDSGTRKRRTFAGRAVSEIK